MKKLLLLLIVAVAGFWFYRSTSTKEEPPVVTTSPNKAIPQKEATAGSSLNAAFPKSSGDFTVRFTQEKDGFSQAELLKGAGKLATLSISDTAANPSARDKFKTATKKIAGHPAAAVGAQGTALLVADRFQVQVRSLQPAFSASDREAWLEKFNLAALNK